MLQIPKTEDRTLSAPSFGAGPASSSDSGLVALTESSYGGGFRSKVAGLFKDASLPVYVAILGLAEPKSPSRSPSPQPEWIPSSVFPRLTGTSH